MIPKRLAMISEHASPLALVGGVDTGGQNIYVGQLARHLAELGYRVDIFTRRDGKSLPQIVTWHPGVRVIHVNAGPPEPVRKEALLPFMEEFAAWMRRFCLRQPWSYDLVHANFWMSGKVAMDLRRRLQLPFMVTFHALGRVRRLHQNGADEFPEERGDIEQQTMREAERIIAECPQDREDMMRLYGADAAKISVIACGFDPAEFWPIPKSLARAALGLPARERLILQLGRIVRRKGIDNVIRGLGRLVHEKNVEARLVVVGGDSAIPDPARTPELAYLQNVARAEEVADRVVFAGGRGRDVLKHYYSAADVFVTTPWYEPFGITPLEAMACGTPVISSEVGGLKYSVRHGHTGFCVPPNDPEALAERLAEILQTPALRRQLSRQALEHVHERFTWRHVARAAAELFETVIGEGHVSVLDAA